MPRSNGNLLSFPEGTTLRACGPDGVAELKKFWREADVRRHTLIVAEDDIDDDVFFILAGHARAATFTERGREVLLSELPAGEAFGFFAAIDGHPRSTNVISVEDSRIARMAAPDFRKVLYSHPDVNRAFMLYLVDRIRSTSGRFTTVATLNAEQRLISEILRLAKRGLTGKNTAVIDPVPTQKDLALLTFAAHREAVGRDMSKLRDAGLIERKGRKLIIKNLSGLAARLRID